ncbi:MAG TPA: MFS transporter [Vineibacter sp.]|nr:MFS transporter [Vineibacter sp.]
MVRSTVIGLTAFLTVVDLFATQALLPALTRIYGATPAAMSVAVNASTIGMAVAGLAVALFSRHIDRRRGTLLSLALLSIPTALLAVAPDLTIFTLLRITQGLLMATAFTLTLAYLGEHSDAADTAGAFAAYITGNVASNLFGRLLAASLADHVGLASSFGAFALLNLAGAALVYVSLGRTPVTAAMPDQTTAMPAWGMHLRNPLLRLCFAVGFLILFAFIGTFTYVNFVLAGPRFGIGMMMLGVIYLVFLPSIFTTPFAGRIAQSLGTRPALALGIGIALLGLPLLLLHSLPAVLAGLTLVAVGTFFGQAVMTGFVSRAAARDRGAANGLYLASYFSGGLVGSALLGQLYDHFGWTACVIGVAAALVAILILCRRLNERSR